MENERYKGKKRKIKKNTWEYDVFSILGKDGISSSYKHDITPLSKKQNDLLPKNTPEDDISNNTKKDETHS